MSLTSTKVFMLASEKSVNQMIHDQDFLMAGSYGPLGYDSSNNQIIGFTQTTAYTGTLPAVGTLAEVTTGNLPALWLRVA